MQAAYRRLTGLVIGALLIGGCQTLNPVVPTLPPVLTSTAIPTDTAAPTFPVVTPLPTWTPLPTRTLPPTFTPLPPTVTHTPRPPTATANPTAEIPLMVTRSERGAVTLTLTEAQLNAAIARRFDAAPLASYAAAPRVTIRDGALDMRLLIRPQHESNPQTLTLTVALAIYGGDLEIHAMHLAPLDVGVTTPQIKLGQGLLQQALADLVNQAAGTNTPTRVAYNYVQVQPEGVLLTVVAS
ncbi:MAG: hypothetical protein IT324_06355 [Anaerolineae bacterium]|nr:hypothetical protein [Anaerolineae bacterium]